MKTRFSLVLWASYVLTMLASIGHLAWTFGTLEPSGFAWVGWLPAVSIDAGLAALAYAIQQRKRAGRRAWSLWGGVAVFAGISAYANTLHALSVAPAELGKALVLSAVLPLLVVYLGEIISADDAAAANAAERAQAKAEAAQERERLRLERAQAAQDAERATQTAAQVALEAQIERNQAALAVLDAPRDYVVCEYCEGEYSNRNALSAHMRFCAARKAQLAELDKLQNNGVAHE